MTLSNTCSNISPNILGQTLPDIAAQIDPKHPPLDWAGMENVALPVLFQGERIHARANAGVNLKNGTRGIHMSRIYLALEALEAQPLSPVLIKHTLQSFLDSHQHLSDTAYLTLYLQPLIKRPALVSKLAGYKEYPIEIKAKLDKNGLHLSMRIDITYSSTCPCSAALARQLIQQQFNLDFNTTTLNKEDVLQWLSTSSGIIATPHSQRSNAQLQFDLNADIANFPCLAIIDAAETALGTAVQTAVKRADEQAFALANGQNAMFCEDAARRLHIMLIEHADITAFEVKVIHAESLHAHDAVAISRFVR